MAYKYFTKELLAKSNDIELANIFAEKQQKAKETLHTNYSLPEIAEWIKDNTNNFKKSENYFIDLDQALKRVVFKYYDSTNKANPFLDNVMEVAEVSTQPRKPSEVSMSGVTSKAEVVEQITDSIESQIEGAIESIKLMIDIEPENESYKETLAQLEVTLDSIKG